jgi:hypothetical protein
MLPFFYHLFNLLKILQINKFFKLAFLGTKNAFSVRESHF